jgi:hypothetical protein
VLNELINSSVVIATPSILANGAVCPYETGMQATTSSNGQNFMLNYSYLDL